MENTLKKLFPFLYQTVNNSTYSINLYFGTRYIGLYSPSANEYLFNTKFTVNESLPFYENYYNIMILI